MTEKAEALDPIVALQIQTPESQVRAGAPHLGEHNKEVLEQWLRWSPEQIQRSIGIFDRNTGLT